MTVAEINRERTTHCPHYRPEMLGADTFLEGLGSVKDQPDQPELKLIKNEKPMEQAQQIGEVTLKVAS